MRPEGLHEILDGWGRVDNVAWSRLFYYVFGDLQVAKAVVSPSGNNRRTVRSMTEAESSQPQAETAGPIDGLQHGDRFYRIFGVVLIIIGAICAKFFIVDFLESVRAAHNSAVLIHSKLVMLPPILVTLGLLLSVGGGKALKAIQNAQRSGFNVKTLLVVLVMILPSLGVQFWVEGELQKMGYQTDDK